MQHAHRVDRTDAREQASQCARDPWGLEGVARALDTVCNPLLERRALLAAVYQLDRKPRQSEPSQPRREWRLAGIEEPNHEGRRRHVLIQPAERHSLFPDARDGGGPAI